MNKYAIAGGAAVAVLFAGAASAATMNYASTASFTDVALTFAAGDGNVVSLPQWNPALFPGMTLTQVDIYWSGSLTGSLGFTGYSADAVVYEASAKATLTGSGPSALEVVVIPQSYLVEAGSPVYVPGTFLSPGFVSVGPVEGTANVQQTFTTGLGAFTGSGDVTWDFGGEIGNVLDTGGILVPAPSGTASADAYVIYTFETSDVPVPAALPLLGAGLAGLGFVARRRKA